MLRAFHSYAFRKAKDTFILNQVLVQGSKDKLMFSNQGMNGSIVVKMFSKSKDGNSNQNNDTIKSKFLSLFGKKVKEEEQKLEKDNVKEKVKDKESKPEKEKEGKAGINQRNPQQSMTMNKQKFHNEDLQEDTKKLTKIKIMQKPQYEDLNSEEYFAENLHNTAPRLPPGQPTHKWEQFFKRTNNKILLDLNRAVKNDPDKIYMDFFFDIKNSLNSTQYLFALKNILLNSTNDVRVNMQEIMSYTLVFIMDHKKLDVTSKLNMLTLLEILNIFPQKQNFNKEINIILEELNDYYRVHSTNYTIEEYLLLLNVLVENNIYDSYLINNFFEKFKTGEIKKLFSEKKVYKILYFNNEIKLYQTLIKLIERYNHFNFNNLNAKMGDIFESIIEMFMISLNSDSISISDIQGLRYDPNILFSFLETDNSILYQRAMNNLILTKINKNLEIFYPEEMNMISLIDLGNYTSLLLNMKKDYYDEELMSDLYHKLCYITHDKLKQSEIINILFEKNKIAKPNSKIKILCENLITNLVESSINLKLYNKYIIEPFIMLLENEITLGQKGDEQNYLNTLHINKLLILFGSYNFDEVLKKEEFSAKILDCYFKIILKLDKEVSKYSNKVMDFVHKIPSHINKNSSVVKDEDVGKMLKQFYEPLVDIVEYPDKVEETKSMFLKQDTFLSEELGYNIIRLRSIDKKYLLLYYFPDKFTNLPTNRILEGSIRNDLTSALGGWMDYLITAINYKVISISHVQMFLDFIYQVHSAVDEENTLYDIYLKPLLLNNRQMLEKFSKILNFIFYPQNYYSVFDNSNKTKFTQEKLIEILKQKYDLEKYKMYKNKPKDEINVNIKYSDKFLFKENILESNKESTSATNSNTDLEEFLGKYYFKSSNENLISALVEDKGFEISFKHLSEYLTKNVNKLFYDPEQINLISEEKDGEDVTNLCLYKTLMDLAKISQTVDHNIIYNKGKDENSDKEVSINKSNNEFYFGSTKNLSSITSKEILNSFGFKQFQNEYNEYKSKIHNKDNNKLPELKKYKLDKMIDKVIRHFPIYPYFSFYIFSTIQNPDQLNWLTILNTKYKLTEITDLEFENKISYLKSQYDNILII